MSDLSCDRVEVKSDTQTDHDIPHLALHDFTTPRTPASPEYMVHSRFLQPIDVCLYSTDLHQQSTSSTPGELDRRHDHRNAARLGTDRQDLGRHEVARRHVGRIRTESHSPNQTLGDYGDCPRRLGRCESGRPDHGVSLNILCWKSGYRWRALGEYSVIAHDFLDSQTPFLSSSSGVGEVQYD